MSASNSRSRFTFGALIFAAALAPLAGAAAQTPAAPAAPPPPVSLTPPPPSPPAPLSQPAARADAIAVDVLEELGAERVGLLDDGSGALPAEMWAGSDPALVRALLAQLPRRMPSLAMRRLAHRLLLAPARQPRVKANPLGAAPEAVDDPAVRAVPWLLEARIAALAAMGDWGNVTALVDLIPAERMSEGLVRLKVDGLLIAGQTAPACAEAQAALARRPDAHWQKTLVYCQFATKQPGAAQFGLSLLREQGETDPAFFWAADLLQGLKTPAPADLRRLTPLELVMLRAAAKPFPEAAVAEGDPTLLRVLAAMPPLPPDDPKAEAKLTAAQKKERARAQQEARIALSERAVALGVLEPEMLRARYLDLDLGQDAPPPAIADATADSVRARARLFQLARAQTSETARAEVIARAVALARADRGEKGPDLVVVARVYAELLAGIAPSPELLWFADAAARGLLAAGLADRAHGWFELVRQMARGSSEAAELADNLWAVEHLATGRTRPAQTPRHLRAWQATLTGADALVGRAHLLNLLAALGDPIAGAEWLPVVDAVLPSVPAVLPSAPQWHLLTLAARDARLGEAVALALGVIGEGGLRAAPAVALHKAVESLRIAGREDDARALAAEAALVQGL